MSPAPRVAAVVLAAGSSRRMGEQHKLLAELDGTPMVRRVINAASKSSVFSITVVVGCRGDEVLATLKGCDIKTVNNPDYSAGLASSLHVGLSSLSVEIDGAIIILADMPFVDAGLIDVLIRAFGSAREKDIIVPIKSGRLGNPVIWPARLFPEMMKLKGDAGAKLLLSRFAKNITTVPVVDESAFFDVDTPSELEQANLKFD